MLRTARFLYLILVITTVQQSSSQTCPANFISAPASLSCPAFLSCRTTEGCCGSCSGSDGQCYAYTFGTTCSNTPISCPTDFSPLPSDATGSRPRGSCPATRPYQTTDGCCGACRTTDNRIFPYVCRTTSGTTCSNTLSTGCSSTVTGTSITPPATCPIANFIPVSTSGTCPASRSCMTTGGCCGSCTGSDGRCYAYTYGTTCSDTRQTCPANFDALPSDDTGSRPSGSCPPWRPYQTTTGCCGACRTTSNTIMPYVCRTTSGTLYCATVPGPGCQSTVPGTSAPPPPTLPPLTDEDIGALVGFIILGVIILACMCACAAVCVCLRQRQDARRQPQFSNYVSNTQPSSSHAPAVSIAMQEQKYSEPQVVQAVAVAQPAHQQMYGQPQQMYYGQPQ
jgi:hypothetical protein